MIQPALKDVEVPVVKPNISHTKPKIPFGHHPFL
jgi:hypothetical protein